MVIKTPIQLSSDFINMISSARKSSENNISYAETGSTKNRKVQKSGQAEIG